MTTQYLKLLKHDNHYLEMLPSLIKAAKKRQRSYLTTEYLKRATIQTNYQAPKLSGRELGIISPSPLKILRLD